MKIVIVGSGNTATVLGRLIKQSDHDLVQVVSRSITNAQALAMELGASFGELTAPSYEHADIYIIALQDHVLSSLEKYPGLKNRFVVHTAGSVGMRVLEKISDRYGVLYPLQTLSKFTDHLPAIPFMVDANNADTLDTIMQFAKTLSGTVSHANDKQRSSYHIAAVFAANFANHMYALAEIYCQREQIEFKNVLPLIQEISDKVSKYSPYLTQTGPAMRDDVFTMSRHLEALSPYPDLKYMYLKLTENIVKIHGKR